jgi:hypothetical protein
LFPRIFLHKRQIGLVAFLIDLLQIIINPFAYVAGDEDTKLTDSISNSLEPICRQLLYAMQDFLHKRQIGLVAFFENADLSDCSI